jgi:DNA adenine methylase
MPHCSDTRTKFRRPFLKWAGNKYPILPRIIEQLPEGEQLIEPFVGSAAVFLNTDYKRYLLNDINPDLINLYRILSAQGEDFIDRAQALFIPQNNTEQVYYALRRRFNTLDDPTEKAALFVYLNRHAYNGLCRYNASHEFNVPFGRYRRPYFPRQEMRVFQAKAQYAELLCGDFKEVMSQAQHGAVVYADPPYVPLNATSSFTSYSSSEFGVREQSELAEKAEELARGGIPVLISNHNTSFTRQAYRNARRVYFEVQRFISCKGDQRHKVSELLALFESLPHT